MHVQLIAAQLQCSTGRCTPRHCHKRALGRGNSLCECWEANPCPSACRQLMQCVPLTPP